MCQKRKTPSFRRFLKLMFIDLLVLAVIRMILTLHGCTQNEKVASVYQNNESAELLALMYHSVRNGPESGYSVTPQTLAADFQYLAAHDFEAVSPEDLVRFVTDGVPLPSKPVLLTFDDGFYNNLAYVLPLLKQYDFCAVVNIVGEFTEELAPVDSHVPAYSYLTAEDCRELLDSGRVTLGNHTTKLHHRTDRRGCAINKDESESRYHAIFMNDISHLQEFLHRELSFEPIVFAYPYGFDCAESIPVLKDSGFLVTLTCYEHWNEITQGDVDSLYGLGRYNRAGNQSTDAFFTRILGESCTSKSCFGGESEAALY